MLMHIEVDKLDKHFKRIVIFFSLVASLTMAGVRWNVYPAASLSSILKLSFLSTKKRSI